MSIRIDILAMIGREPRGFFSPAHFEASYARRREVVLTIGCNGATALAAQNPWKTTMAIVLSAKARLREVLYLLSD